MSVYHGSLICLLDRGPSRSLCCVTQWWFKSLAGVLTFSPGGFLSLLNLRSKDADSQREGDRINFHWFNHSAAKITYDWRESLSLLPTIPGASEGPLQQQNHTILIYSALISLPSSIQSFFFHYLSPIHEILETELTFYFFLKKLNCLFVDWFSGYDYTLAAYLSFIVCI